MILTVAGAVFLKIGPLLQIKSRGIWKAKPSLPAALPLQLLTQALVKDFQLNTKGLNRLLQRLKCIDSAEVSHPLVPGTFYLVRKIEIIAVQ